MVKVGQVAPGQNMCDGIVIADIIGTLLSDTTCETKIGFGEMLLKLFEFESDGREPSFIISQMWACFVAFSEKIYATLLKYEIQHINFLREVKEIQITGIDTITRVGQNREFSTFFILITSLSF